MLKEELPKQIQKKRFEEFLGKIKEDFPLDKAPELLVQYQEIDSDKILILGFGEESECAQQTVEVLGRNPNLKANEFKLKVLRVPRTKLLLR